MVQPSKRSLSAQRHFIRERERISSGRSAIVFVSIGLIVVALAGLALDRGFVGFRRQQSLPQSKEPSKSTRKMEPNRVDKKQVLSKDAKPTPAKDDSGGYFTLVSMNIAGCVPSQMAPETWTQQNSIDAVKSIILSHRPDWIALQEVRGGLNAIGQEFEPEGYKAVGATYSHADQVVLLVKKEIEAKLVPTPLPVIMAELNLGEHRLLAASVHLEPFQQGFAKRAKQVEAIIEKANSVSLPVVIAGDTNMRQTEDEVMEGDLQLLDVWKLAGSNTKTKFTWDTVDHRSDDTEDGESEGYFNQYYGESTRQYYARYDRIYIHHANHSIEVGTTMENSPVTFDLIANKPMTSKLDFLSDHFGIVSKLPIQWK